MPTPAGSEARFTPPRPDCPYPEHWHSTDDDSTELEVTALVGAFVTALQPEFVIETGTAFGQTAKAIGQALLANGHGHLVTLESDPVRAELSRNRCAGLPVKVLKVSSLDYEPDAPVDFCWFDSLIDIRHLEFLRYLPCMSSRAVVGFHDTGPQHAVRRHLERLVASEVLPEPLWLPTPRGVCFARVMGSK
ncbi:MAG: class I SAM-dependent methyltransferase [Pseudonocardiaceae bacterium]